jgi:hypothetical protein
LNAFTAQHFADKGRLFFDVSISMVWDWLTLELMITVSVLIVSPIGTDYPTWVLFFDISV